MTRVLAIDIETTGIEAAAHQITEVGWVIKEIGNPKPFVMKSRFCLLAEGTVLDPDNVALTKITLEHCSHGTSLCSIVKQINTDILRFGVKYVVAHNGLAFDKPFIEAKLPAKSGGDLCSLPWLDTKTDIVFPKDCASTSLMYVAAYYGFVNAFPHAALFDAMTCLKILELQDVDAVIARSKEPWVIAQAVVSFDEKDLAKARRYGWETIGLQKYPKKWVKKLKESEFLQEKAEAPFPVVRLD